MKYNAITITKVYDYGDSGYYRRILKKTTVNRDALIDDWELYCPTFMGKTLTFGVKRDSGISFMDFNDVAYELFNIESCGNCIIAFELQNDKEFEVIANLMKNKLLKAGMKKDNIKW